MVKKTNQILKNNLYGCINKNTDGDDAYFLNLRGLIRKNIKLISIRQNPIRRYY